MVREFTEEQIDLSLYPDVKLEYLRTYKNDLCWGIILEKNELEEEWISEFEPELKAQYELEPDAIDLWYTLTSTQKLSLHWIREHPDMINFNALIKKSNLDQEILYEYLDKFSFEDICKYQKLSEEFINSHEDQIIWEYISNYTDLTFEFIAQHKNVLNWNKISYIYKFNTYQLKLVDEHVVKKNNILYMSKNKIRNSLKPNFEIINDAYIVGYIDFEEYDPKIYCYDEPKQIEYGWNIISSIINNSDPKAKELESKTFNYKLYDVSDEKCDENIKHYGFRCSNTIKECVYCSFNCGFISKHIIKVYMPIETTIPKVVYGEYNGFYAKKIIIVEEVYYNE